MKIYIKKSMLNSLMVAEKRSQKAFFFVDSTIFKDIRIGFDLNFGIFDSCHFDNELQFFVRFYVFLSFDFRGFVTEMLIIYYFESLKTIFWQNACSAA